MSKKSGNGTHSRAELFRKFHSESAGLIKVTLLRPAREGVAAVLDLEGGLRFALAVAAWTRTIPAGGPRPQCLTCDRDVKPWAPAALFEMRPYSGKSTVAVFSGVCQACGVLDDESLIEKASKAIEANLTGLRRIDWPGPAGKA